MTTLTITRVEYVESLDAELMGLPARMGGYGLLLGVTGDGDRITRAGDPMLLVDIADRAARLTTAEIAARSPRTALGWPGDDMFGAYWHMRDVPGGERVP